MYKYIVQEENQDMPTHQKMFLALLCLTDVLILTPSCTVHGFENARYAVTEREETEAAEGQDRVDTTFKLNVKGTTNFGSLTLIGDITSKAGPDTGHSTHRTLNSPYIVYK